MAENVLKLMINVNPQIQEAHQTPVCVSTRKAAHWHILVKLLKSKEKEKILKSARGEKTHYIQRYENEIDLSKTVEVRTQWHDIFRLLGKKYDYLEFYTQQN